VIGILTKVLNFHLIDANRSTRVDSWQRGCLQQTKPRHFGDVMLTGKLLSPNVYFQIEMEN
jgi:hypothetical protein